MALRLSHRHKVFIAGIIGAAVLCVGFYLLMADVNAGRRDPYQLFLALPLSVAKGFYLASPGRALLAISGFTAGALYVALARADRLTSSIPLAMYSGATAGLLIFLVTSLATLAGASGTGLAEAISATFTGAFDMAPVFILIILLLALLAAAGGTACKLALVSIAKLRSW